jgi:hypothetical protein
VSEPPDDLAGLLGPPPGSSDDPCRRARTFAATTRTLRRRRALRQLAFVAGAIGLFAAGGGVGWVVKPTPPAEVVVARPATPQPVAPLPVEAEPLTAERLELQGELADDPNDAARLYREAGDRFLTARDYENAARCYRRHLAVADADARKASAADSWMLHTMKTPAR